MSNKAKLTDSVWKEIVGPNKRKALINNEVVKYDLCAQSRNAYDGEP